MTNEELILEYRAGNVKALDELIQQNKGLINMVALRYKGWCSSVIDFDDLAQEGTIGLMKAVEKYDFNNEKKASFSTYAFLWIKQCIYRFIDQKGKSNQDISLYTETGDNTELIDCIADKEDYICKVEESIYYKELKAEVHQTMNECLTLKQRNVIELRYGFYDMEPTTLDQIGNVIGANKQGVDRLIKSSLRKLRWSKWGQMKANEMRREQDRDYI